MSMYELTSLLWRRRALVIAIAGALFVVAAVAVLLTRPTTYTARSEVLLDQPGLLVEADGITVPNKLGALLPTFCKLLQGDQVASEIADRANETIDDVRGAVRCSPIEGTVVLAVSARTGDAERSLAIVDAATDALVDEIEARWGDDPEALAIEASLLRASDLPGRDPRRTLRSLVLVAVGAVVAASAFAVAAEPHRVERRREPVRV